MPSLACRILVLLFLTPVAQAEVPDFETFLSDRMKAHQVAGAGVALVRPDGSSEILTLGVVSADTSDPVRPETVFQVGSVSKPVAAWVVMTLVERGRVGLDVPVGRYLTRWKLPESEFDANGVTLRRLLSHTAGLSLSGYAGFPETLSLPSIEASLDGASGIPVVIQQRPGLGFSYSGGGYTLLQLVVEEVTGMSFEAYAQQAVLQPLGMKSSSYHPGETLRAARATPHGFSLDPIPQHHFRAQAAASLHSTIGDLAGFVRANLEPGPVLSADAQALMRAGVADFDGGVVGLGLFGTADGTVFGHGGSNFGWKADIRFAPGSGHGIAVLTNSESGGAFARDVVCRWADFYGLSSTSLACRAAAASEQDQRTLLVLVSVVLWALTVLVIGVVGYLVKSRGMKLAWPERIGARTMAVLLVLVVVAASGLLFTGLGAYLAAGIWTYFATVDYLPPGARGVVVSAIALCVALILLSCTVRKEELAI